MNNTLRTIGIAFVLVVILGSAAWAQNVNITATGGTPNASYATLKAAFDAVNAGTHTGAITMDVVANTTEPANTSAVLNGSGAGTASYTSLIIRPTVDGVSITGTGGNGSICGGKGLIELNGADNVTIDGDNPNTAGTNRNLTLKDTCSMVFASVIRIALATSGTNTANNNTFKNLVINGSAPGLNIPTETHVDNSRANTTYGIYAGSGASTSNQTTAPTQITGRFTSIGSGATAANLTISNNRITSAARGTSIQGSALTVFPGLLISNNTIGNPVAGDPDGVYNTGVSVSGSNNGVIRDNTIWVESYLATSQTGIDPTATSVNTSGITIERNRVLRVVGKNDTGAITHGISLLSGDGHIVRNNFITGVVNRPTPSVPFNPFVGANGIYINRGGAHKIYHNTVVMSGDTPDTTGNLTAALAFGTNSGNNSDVRNNILVNTQTQSGAADPAASGFVCFYIKSGVTSTFNLILNNNDYFQGTAVNNGIAQVGQTAGTGFYTAANFDPNNTTPATNFRSFSSTLTLAGTNDNASKVVDPMFVSATDFHILPGSPMVNAGVNVGVFNDIDGEIRVNARDIGADEADGASPGQNDIAATALLNPVNGALVGNTTAFAPSAAFTNYGVTTQANVPVRYQILDSSNAVVYDQTATVPSIAQNAAATASFPSTTLAIAGTYTIKAIAELVGDKTPANDTITGTITVLAAISGNINVGAGQAYTSLTNAGGLFEALNIAGASGAVTINISSDLSGESGTIRLNEMAGGAAVTIKPSGVPRTISGSPTNNSALIALNGADNVTIDGSLNGGTDRSLTININTGSAGINLGSGSNGAQNNTVKNVNVNGYSSGTIYGIISGGNTVGANGAANNGNRIQNNNVQTVNIGIASLGASAANKNTGTVITQNTINGIVSAANGGRGIYITFDDGAQITRNTISGINVAGFGAAVGINAGFGNLISTSNSTGSVVSNAVIAENNIGSVIHTNAFSAIGIAVAGSTTGTNTVANNVISGVVGSSTGSNLTTGIFVGTAGGGTQNVYHNSVSMIGDRGTDNSLSGSFGLAINGGDHPVNVKNNVFYNTQTQTGPSTAGKSYAIGIGYSAFTNLSSDNNVLFASGPQSKFAITGVLNNSDPNPLEYVALFAYRAATGLESNSLALDPKFVSASDLHIQSGVPTPVENRGTAIAAITTDFDGDARNPTTPDIGADEGTFLPLAPNDIAASSIIFPVAGNVIVGGSIVSPVAVFANNGANTQTNVQVQFTITGPGGYNYSNTFSIASLTSGTSTSVLFGTAPPMTVPGTYTMTATNLFADSNTANDSVTSTFPVLLPLNGSYDVGVGQAHTSLTNPGGVFAALNFLGASGNVVINLTSDLTEETGEVVLNQLPAGVHVTIKPAGAPRVVSGTGFPALITINDADNVTIDGSLNGGTDRSLTFINNRVSFLGTVSPVIWLASGATGANSNTIKNTIVKGGSSFGTDGIVSSFAGEIGAPGNVPNSNNNIENNHVSKVRNAVLIIGPATTTQRDQNWTVTKNTFGSNIADEKLGWRGVFIAWAQNFNISENVISGISSDPNTFNFMCGIWTDYGNDTGLITRNEIKDIRQNNVTGGGSSGIVLWSNNPNTNLTVTNNMISDVASDGTDNPFGLDNGSGIAVYEGAGFKVWNNTVRLNTSQPDPASITMAMYVGHNVTTAGAIDLRNNILVNEGSVGTRYGVYVNGLGIGSAVFSNINHNNYTGQNIGFLGTAHTTLAGWQTATGQDANSLSVDPLFLLATDQHLLGASTLINAGTPITGITTDFDGQTRDSTPDIGADEFVVLSETASISGRIVSQSGQGVGGVYVTISGGNLQNPRFALTNAFGYFTLPDVPQGPAYVVVAASKRYTISPPLRIVTLQGDVTNLVFVAGPLDE